MLSSRDVFEYTGYGHAGVLNRLTQKNVRVIRAETAGNRLIICTRARDRQKIIDLFNELCYNYTILKTEGVSQVVDGLLKRSGLVIGLLAFIAMITLLPYYVYDLNVSGGAVDVSVVEEVLREEGIERGKFKFRLDTAAVERALQGIDGVAFATVSRRGAVISVEIFPELPPVTLFDVALCGQVTCTTDAIISRQLIFSGTATHAKGDAVKRGDVLIDGAVAVGEARVETSARGEVYGLVSYSASVLYDESHYVRARSGNAEVFRGVELGGLKSAKPESPYAMYETQTNRVRCGFIIPLDVTTITFYELVDEVVTAPFSVVEAEIAAEATAMAEEKVPAGARIMHRHVRVTESGGKYLIEATVQVEQRIDDQNG
jgi:Putative stage IV sporulation protein YqfD.